MSTLALRIRLDGLKFFGRVRASISQLFRRGRRQVKKGRKYFRLTGIGPDIGAASRRVNLFKTLIMHTRPNLSQPSSRFGLVYQSVCSRTIANILNYDWIAEKNWSYQKTGAWEVHKKQINIFSRPVLKGI